MDEISKWIKENMNKTELNKLKFREENKLKVRKIMYSTRKDKKLKKLYPRILSIGFTCAFILGIGYLAFDKSDTIQQTKSPASQSDIQQKNNSENTIYTPPQQEENFSKMTKEEVVHKLLNTIDYFQNASGKYEFYNKYYDNSESNVTVEYKESFKNLIGGYQEITSFPDKNNVGSELTTKETYFNENTYWILDPKRMTYYEDDYIGFTGKEESVESEDVFSIPIDKIADLQQVFRKRLSYSDNQSLLPDKMTARYLRFNNLWGIEKQNQELLGHNTIVLQGSIDKSIVDDMQPDEKSFRFWVDKDTGILVKYEIYNEKNEIVSYLHPVSLSVNVSMEPNQFTPNLENYKPNRFMQAKNQNPTDLESE